jgi:hypothetical protein
MRKLLGFTSFLPFEKKSFKFLVFIILGHYEHDLFTFNTPFPQTQLISDKIFEMVISFITSNGRINISLKL